MRTSRSNLVECRWRPTRLAAGALIVLGAAVWTGPELAAAAPDNANSSDRAAERAKPWKGAPTTTTSTTTTAPPPTTTTSTTVAPTTTTTVKPKPNPKPTTTTTTTKPNPKPTTTTTAPPSTGGGGGTTGGTGGNAGGGNGGGAGTDNGGGAGAGTGGTPPPSPSAPTSGPDIDAGAGAPTVGPTASTGGGSAAFGARGNAGVGATGTDRRASVGTRGGAAGRAESVTVPAQPGGSAVAALQGPDNAAQATVRSIQSGQGMPSAGGANLYAQLAAAPAASDKDDIPSNPYVVFVILSLFGVGVALTGRIRTPLPATAVRRHPMLAG